MPPTTPDISRWFLEQIQPHEPQLKAWLRARFPQLQDVDDLVQDAYLRLVRAKGDGKLEHPRAYLYTIAKNAALDRCRRQQVVAFESLGRPGTTEVEAEAAVPAEGEDHDFELSILAEAINALPERCREILILRKRQGLARPEIARRLGVSIHTVNAQLTVGLVKCREYFRQKGLLEVKSHGSKEPGN